MDLNKLKQKENSLRPYDFFVALFDQAGGDVAIPIFNTILFNSFKETPTFTNLRLGTGLYEIQISNYEDFKITDSDDINVSVSQVVSASSVDRLQVFFNRKFDKIEIHNVDLDTRLLSNFTGQFVMYYYKYY